MLVEMHVLTSYVAVVHDSDPLGDASDFRALVTALRYVVLVLYVIYARWIIVASFTD